MTVRAAFESDIDAVERIYDKLHTAEENGSAVIGWRRGVYPTRATALEALSAGELFVLSDGGGVCAAGRINRRQLPEYYMVKWLHEAPDSAVMVLHTLVVDPDKKRRGYGRAFLDFYENYARENGCAVLRIDTNTRNAAARKMYAAFGWREAGIVPCGFKGLPCVQLVCLEKPL